MAFEKLATLQQNASDSEPECAGCEDGDVLGPRRVKVDCSKFSHLGVTLGENILDCGAAIECCHDADLIAASGLQVSDVIIGVHGKDVTLHEPDVTHHERALSL